VLDLDPDARMSLVGAHSLGDAELLSFLLTRGGAPGLGSLELARSVLSQVGGSPRLPEMTEGRLRAIPGIGPTKARRIVAAMCLASRVNERPLPRGAKLTDPEQLYNILRGRSVHAMHEHFWVMALDHRRCRLQLDEIARGSSNRVFVDVGQVFRMPLLEGAHGVMLAHNHPSGDPTPSPQDIALTKRIAAAGDLLGIEVYDHIVIGHQGFVSLEALGYLPAEPVGFRTADEAADGS